MVLDVIRYGCGESKLKEISLESVKGAISLCYYFIASAIKAHRKFTHDPLSGLTEKQRAIYNELPINFETGEGVEVAKAHKVRERGLSKTGSEAVLFVTSSTGPINKGIRPLHFPHNPPDYALGLKCRKSRKCKGLSKKKL